MQNKLSDIYVFTINRLINGKVMHIGDYIIDWQIIMIQEVHDVSDGISSDTV